MLSSIISEQRNGTSVPYHNLTQSIRNNTVHEPLILYRVVVVLYVDCIDSPRVTGHERSRQRTEVRPENRFGAQQHGTNETRNTLNTNLNTNLMQGHRDSSVSPCSLPEITEHRIFYILFYCEQISLKGIKFCT